MFEHLSRVKVEGILSLKTDYLAQKLHWVCKYFLALVNHVIF